MIQTSLFTYPNSPGFKARGTSEDAADAIAPKAATLRERVLDLLKTRALSADQCADILNESSYAIRPRCTELFKQGLICDTGMRAVNRSGKKAVMWRAVGG